MSEEEIQYVCNNFVPRKNKKKIKFNETLNTLKEMFPDIDDDIIEQCYKANKGSLQKTINVLIEYQDVPKHCEQINKNESEENLDKYIREFEKLEKQEQEEKQSQDKNKNNQLNETLSQIWINEEVQKDSENFIPDYQNEDDFCMLDVIGVDSNHIPQEFVKNVQQYLFYLINQEANNIIIDQNEFPYLSSVEFGVNEQEKFMHNAQIKTISKNEIPTFTLLQKLCEDFPNMQFSQINYAFEQLGGYDNCKMFLAKYYRQDYRPYEIVVKKKQTNTIKQQQLQSYTINERFKFLSINQLKSLLQKNRESLKALRSDNYVVNRCAGKYGNQAKVGQLQHFYESQLQKIKIYEKEGIDIFVALVVAEQNFTRIDLHGFYGAEIEELLDVLIEQITIFKTNSNKKKINVEFIVGRGLHSKNRQPVVGPIAIQYFRSQNYPIVSQQDGRMIINI